MKLFKNLGLVLVIAVITLMLSPKLWPHTAGMPGPTGSDLPYYIFLGIVESLAFGVGILFLLKGWELVNKADGVSKNLKTWAYVSIAWQLMSWWPHDNFHQVIGEDFHKLLYIEYGFHLTLIISSAIVASFFVTVLKNR